MTKKILLALALTLATAPLTSAPALACGGRYAPALQREASAVREAIERSAIRAFRVPSPYVYDIAVEGDRASARVRLRPDSDAERTVRLHRRGGAWRVVAFG